MVKKIKLPKFVLYILAILISVAIGGLFVSGTTLSFPLLSYLPLIIHQIVGWIVIGITILGVILDALKKLKM